MAESIKKGTAEAGASIREDGAIGSAFKHDGAIGSIGQSIGGPFDKKGAIGHQFTTEGSIGGTAQALGEKVSGAAASSLDNPQAGAADRSDIPKDR